MLKKIKKFLEEVEIAVKYCVPDDFGVCQGLHFIYRKENYKVIKNENGLFNLKIENYLTVNFDNILFENGSIRFIYKEEEICRFDILKIHLFDEKEELVSISKAHKLIGVTRQTLYNWNKDGLLNFVQINSRNKIPVSEVKRIMSHR